MHLYSTIQKISKLVKDYQYSFIINQIYNNSLIF
jgi:hypothetical protein